jgi:hypothetical protein
MRWRDGRRSGNVDDRRGLRAGGGKKVGGGIGVIILALIAMYFGVDPAIVLDQGATPGMSNGDSAVVSPRSPEEDVLAEFVSVVLADTEDVWNDIFRQMGREYREPRLVLFTDAVESACGYAQAAVGPFYCPSDQSVYIDLGFYRDLKLRHQAPGDFAQAYVIAHEVGHHVQKLLGVLDKVNNLRQRVSEVEANQLLVRMELQADCMAGLWANHAHRERQVLEEGDIEEALNAASAIGDDRLQRQSRGYVSPDSFTHGTSAQRVEWFTRGARTGDLNQCDTFAAGRL